MLKNDAHPKIQKNLRQIKMKDFVYQLIMETL